MYVTCESDKNFCTLRDPVVHLLVAFNATR
jgi:hypothetical protein